MKKIILSLAVLFSVATIATACGNEEKKSCSKSEKKSCCKKGTTATKACAGEAKVATVGAAEAPKTCSKAKACCKNKAVAVAPEASAPVANPTPAAH